jgi:hypothetical protein
VNLCSLREFANNLQTSCDSQHVSIVMKRACQFKIT